VLNLQDLIPGPTYCHAFNLCWRNAVSVDAEESVQVSNRRARAACLLVFCSFASSRGLFECHRSRSSLCALPVCATLFDTEKLRYSVEWWTRKMVQVTASPKCCVAADGCLLVSCGMVGRRGRKLCQRQEVCWCFCLRRSIRMSWQER
jgi:hypothetical protein